MHRSLRPFFLAFIFCLGTLQSQAQVALTLSNPDASRFPIVDIGVSTTFNGKPASLINATDFQIRENGIPVNVISLSGCGGSSSAAIALVIDTSESMRVSVGSGPMTNLNYQKFLGGFPTFVSSMPGPSLVTLVPFADSATYSYPGPPAYFYNSSVTSNVDSLTKYLNAFKFTGAGTDVDAGIVTGAQVLAQTTLPRKAIVLVTDAVVTNADSILLFLRANNIALFIMDVSHDTVDTNYANLQLAEATGGGYFLAYDSTLYPTMLQKISQLIFSEHCILEYRSLDPCPAWKLHTVQITVRYQGSSQTAQTSYTVGGIKIDTLPPRLSSTLSGYTTTRVRAVEPFPCESGVQALLDSASSNFKITQSLSPDSAIDLLSPVDSLYPADAYLVAIDSFGNRSRLHVHYTPQPDTHAPQLGAPIRTGALYTIDVLEQLPWDRGVDSVYLATGSVNFQLDSVIFNARRPPDAVRAYLHLIDYQIPGHACLVAIDSVKNRDTLCIQWDAFDADTLPPLFVQDPLAEPRGPITGVVTELRPHDRGLRDVKVTPVFNCTSPTVQFISAQSANVGVTVTDTLYPARALVEAVDSVGNYLRDSLNYLPLPDTHAPIVTYSPNSKASFVFTSTDTQAWDRGIAYLLLLGSSVNATAGAAVFPDGHHATLTVLISDRTQNATVVVQATDSAGHQTTLTVPFTGIPLTPLGDSMIDFGVVTAPASVTRSILLTNQNDIPVVLNVQSPQGDDSVFRVITPTPILFSPFGTQLVAFEFHPNLIGTYKATSLIQHSNELGSITLKGRSIGTVQMSLDTVNLSAGESGTLHLSLDVTPKPSNLDTIGFTIAYNPDLIELGDLTSCANGSPDTGTCLYNASWVGGSEGNRQAMLVRRSTSEVTTLSFGKSYLSIPFRSFVTLHDTSILHLSASNTFSSNVTALHDGLVQAGDICGSPHLRDVLSGSAIPLKILSATPNPASTAIDVAVHSATGASATVQLISVLGEVQKLDNIELEAGDHIVHLTHLPSSSGMFELVITSSDLNVAREKIELVH